MPLPCHPYQQGMSAHRQTWPHLDESIHLRMPRAEHDQDQVQQRSPVRAVCDMVLVRLRRETRQLFHHRYEITVVCEFNIDPMHRVQNHRLYQLEKACVAVCIDFTCYIYQRLTEIWTVSGFSTASNQDLSANDLLLTRFSPSRPPSKGEESGDLLTRGKELASRCWEEHEEFLAKDKIAEWLGGQLVWINLLTPLALNTSIDRLGAQSTRLLFVIIWIFWTFLGCDWIMRSGTCQGL